VEPFDRDELSEQELDSLLHEWQAPEAPARLKRAVFPAPAGPWWRRLWQVRVPLPAAVAMAAALVFGAWRWSTNAGPVVVVKTERVGVPMVQATPNAPPSAEPGKVAPQKRSRELRPVMELKPIILRSAN
jgi:hypothetical protein